MRLSVNGGATFPRTLDDDVSPLGGAQLEWNPIDAIGNLAIRVTSHRLGGTSMSADSAPDP